MIANLLLVSRVVCASAYVICLLLRMLYYSPPVPRVHYKSVCTKIYTVQYEYYQYRYRYYACRYQSTGIASKI